MDRTALLVALRLWSSEALGKQCFLEIRSDNTCAVSIIEKFRSSAGGGLIAREIALDLADGVCEPRRASHVSGLPNNEPDALSRLNGPGATRRSPRF